jgi:hypothetical protein
MPLQGHQASAADLVAISGKTHNNLGNPAIQARCRADRTLF